MVAIEHGSYGGYQQHQKHGVPMTPECGCEEARNTYMREYRARHPEVRAKQRVYAKARLRALSRMASAFPDAYRTFFEEEMRKVRDGKS